MSSRQRDAEIAENLARSQELAEDEHASQALREQLKAQLAAIEEKRSRERLEIVAFGTISSGKSALLNALAGREAFATDILGGTTVARCSSASRASAVGTSWWSRTVRRRSRSRSVTMMDMASSR